MILYGKLFISAIEHLRIEIKSVRRRIKNKIIKLKIVVRKINIIFIKISIKANYNNYNSLKQYIYDLYYLFVSHLFPLSLIKFNRFWSDNNLNFNIKLKYKRKIKSNI